MGAPALVRYGLIEAKKAGPTARFLVNARPILHQMNTQAGPLRLDLTTHTPPVPLDF
jgi:hypothetical protein